MAAFGEVSSQRFPQRGERRFLVGEMMAGLIQDVLIRHPDLEPEPWSTPWRTTVYCDTPDWQIYRSAESGKGMLMRFREYHREHPQRVFTDAGIWLEFKPVQPFTGKTRFAMPASSVPSLLRRETALVPEEEELAGYLSGLLDAGVRPVFATLYHRVAYMNPSETVRVTIDRELSYLTLPDWETSESEAVPWRIGPTFDTESDLVIEMKWQEALPEWAVTVARFLNPYSMGAGERKYVLGVRRLQGLTSHRRGLTAELESGRPGEQVMLPMDASRLAS